MESFLSLYAQTMILFPLISSSSPLELFRVRQPQSEGGRLCLELSWWQQGSPTHRSTSISH